MKKIISIVLVLTIIISLAVCLTGCEAGAQGPQGIQGEQGEQGIQGIQGEKGEQGIQGIQGEKGEQGIQGIQGEKGEQGIQGIQGEKGEQGIQGIQGEKGDTGATIDKVEFDEQGRIVITLTDGTVLDPIEIPEKETHQHDFAEWVTIQSPACERYGLQIRVCIECNYTESQILQPKHHELFTMAAREKTCTVDGLTEGAFCMFCLKVVIPQETIKATGHVMVSEYYESPAECTSCGYISEEKCTECGYRPIISKIAPTGHDLDENGTCQICGTGIEDYWNKTLIDADWSGYYSLENLEYCMIYDVNPDVILPLEYYEGNKINPELYYGTFAYCEWVTAITIPEYYTEIGGEFAYECPNLQYVYIPSTVTWIDNAFSGCYNLEFIHYGGTVNEWCNSVWWKAALFRVDNYDCMIYCSDGIISCATGEVTYYSA